MNEFMSEKLGFKRKDSTASSSLREKLSLEKVHLKLSDGVQSSSLYNPNNMYDINKVQSDTPALPATNSQELEQFAKCEALKQGSLTNSARVKFMLRSLGKIGCKVDPWTFINCVPCVDQITGALHSTEEGHEVVMCQNHVSSQSHFDTVLTHELIHAYDMCRAHVDLTDCRHHACTEVRAAALSGDCNWTEEISRGIIGFGKHFERCVRRRAILSVKFNPHCGEECATEAVDAVFTTCLADQAPFYSIP